MEPVEAYIAKVAEPASSQTATRSSTGFLGGTQEDSGAVAKAVDTKFVVGRGDDDSSMGDRWRGEFRVARDDIVRILAPLVAPK